MSGSEEPGGPRSPPAFAAPWEAEAFALAVHLNEKGVFTWPQFTAALAAVLAGASCSYFEAWVQAIEAVLAQVGAAATSEVNLEAEAWSQAYARTPHGQPVELRRDRPDVCAGTAPDGTAPV